jgi:hypothetical protein
MELAMDKAALEEHGCELVTGNRGLLILDSAGKEHSLARRCGLKTAELNAFMQDVDRQVLPTVEEAKAAWQERRIANLEADRDTVVQEINWEEQLARAGIEKEKQERRFVEPPGREGKQDKELEADRSTVAQEIAWEEDLTRAAIDKDRTDRKLAQFNRAAWAQNREAKVPHEVERQIGEARKCSDSPKAFRVALAEKGISLARATKDDATHSQLESAEAKLAGKWKPMVREGEIVAVTGPGFIWKLVPRVTGDKYPKDIQNFLATLDQPLPSILEAKHDREQDRDFERMRWQDRSATPPHGQGMVQQQAWALDRVRAADEFRRKEDERRREETARRSSGEIDPARYLTDPDYRRQVKAERAYQTPEERRTQRENDLRASLEQQDRQRG